MASATHSNAAFGSCYKVSRRGQDRVNPDDMHSAGAAAGCDLLILHSLADKFVIILPPPT